MKYLLIFILLFAIKAKAQVKTGIERKYTPPNVKYQHCPNKVSKRQTSWGNATSQVDTTRWKLMVSDPYRFGCSELTQRIAFWQESYVARASIQGRYLKSGFPCYNEGGVEFIENGVHDRPIWFYLNNDTLRLSIGSIFLDLINQAKVIEVDGKVFKIETK